MSHLIAQAGEKPRQDTTETDEGFYVPEWAREHFPQTNNGWIAAVPFHGKNQTIDKRILGFSFLLFILIIYVAFLKYWKPSTKLRLETVKESELQRPENFVPKSKEIQGDIGFIVTQSVNRPASESSTSDGPRFSEEQSQRITEMIEKVETSMKILGKLSPEKGQEELNSIHAISDADGSLHKLFEDPIHERITMEKTLLGDYESTHLFLDGDLIFGSSDETPAEISEAKENQQAADVQKKAIKDKIE